MTIVTGKVDGVRTIRIYEAKLIEGCGVLSNLERYLAEIGFGHRFVFDFLHVAYVDETVIGGLMGIGHKIEKAGGRFAVARVSPGVLRKLKYTHLADFLGVRRTIKAAVRLTRNKKRKILAASKESDRPKRCAHCGQSIPQ